MSNFRCNGEKENCKNKIYEVSSKIRNEYEDFVNFLDEKAKHIRNNIIDFLDLEPGCRIRFENFNDKTIYIYKNLYVEVKIPTKEYIFVSIQFEVYEVFYDGTISSKIKVIDTSDNWESIEKIEIDDNSKDEDDDDEIIESNTIRDNIRWILTNGSYGKFPRFPK